MKHILYLALCLSVLPFVCSAQENDGKPAYKNQIAIHPLYIYSNGLRLDFEHRLGNSGNWLMLSAAGFYSDYSSKYLLLSYYTNEQFSSISGGMGELSFKHFIGYPRVRFLFLAAGASFSYYSAKYEGHYLASYEEDGLKYYELRPDGNISHNIPKLGSHLSIGFQTSQYKRFFVDGTLGLGYNYSFYDKEKRIPSSHKFLYGLDRRGLYPVVTFRIGYRLGKP